MARGVAPPPEQQLAQLGQLGLGPGAAPPGLLQMAMGDGGGGRGVAPMLDQGQNPVMGPSPAYTPRTMQGGYNAIFAADAPKTGWFDFQDYNKDPYERLGGGVPGAASTNDWRLLPQGYQDPDYFQYNGKIISRRKIQEQLAPKSVLGTEGTGEPGYSHLKGGGPQWARTFGSQGAYGLDMGQLDPWSIISTPTT